eukprot:gene21529-27876_t
MASSEEQIVELQGDLVEDYIKGQLKLTMWIPSDLAGKVIGRKGTVITNLKLTTKVDHVGAVQPVGNSLWQPVVIIGKIKHIIEAYNEISRMVYGEVDDVVMEWIINFKKPFFSSLNRRTRVLQKISADTNVRIYYPESDYHERHFVDPFTLEGSCYNVQRAYQMLEKEVLAYREYAHQTHSSNERKSKYSNENTASASAENDQKAFPNAPIKTLQRETGKSVPSNVVVDAGNQFSSYGSKVQNTNTDAVGDKKATTNSTSRYGADSATSLSTAKVPSHAEASQSSFAGALKEDTAAGVTSTEKFDKEKLERVEKTIDVPSTLVGLLLSRGPQPNAVAVINQVQNITSTFISKIPSPKYTGKKSAIVEPIGNVVVAAAEVLAAKDDAVVEPNPKDNDKVTKPTETPAAAAAADEVYPVTFRILSFAEGNVDAAIALLQRMIDGERIREVLDSGRISTRSLTQFGNRICELYSASAQPGGRSMRPRTERPERRDKDSSDRPQTSKKWNRDEAVEHQRVPSTWSGRPSDGKRKRSDHSKADKDRQADRGDGPPVEDENGRLSRPPDSTNSGRKDKKERGRGGKPRDKDGNDREKEKDPNDTSARKDEHGGYERRERGPRRGERKPRERDHEDSTANVKGEGTADRDRDGDRDRNPERRRDTGDREKRAPRPGRGGRDGGRDGGGREGRGGRGRRGGRGPGPDGEGGAAEKESAGDP